MAEDGAIDYTLNNPDTLTKYKTAAQISHRVLEAVTGWCTEGAKILSICERGDKLLEDEVAKVYKGKKIPKGISHPTTVSPSSFITPYTPLSTDAEDAATVLKAKEPVKIQLGAQIDGLGTIVCDTIIVSAKGGEVSGREADLMLATYYANELLLRLMIPPGLLASGTDEEKQKASAQKPATQSKITQMLEKVVKSYDCNLVEGTTSWLFDRNEIESKKKIVLAAADGSKAEGIPELGDVWGVEMGVSLGTGKIKTLDNRPTLHRRTAITYQLKRPSSRQILSEIVKKFGTFPFSLRQLEDERAAKVGVVECVRQNVVRQYEVVSDKDSAPVARLLTTIAITKNGIMRLAAPPALDTSKYKTEKKITDEEILKILEQPTARSTGAKSKNKKKKKKPAKKVAEDDEDEDSSDEEHRQYWPAPEKPEIRDPAKRAGIMASNIRQILMSRTSLPSSSGRGRAKPRGVTMASSRMMRSSRLASPMDTATRDNVSLKREAQKPRDKQTSLGDWMEPPLRTPAPSFEDYKGLERQGVLEHMAPLGSFPNHKVKQRLKIHSGPRRSTHLKNAILDEEGATPEPTAPPVSRRSEPRKSEPRTSNVSTSREKDEDRDYTPPTAPKPAAAKGAFTQIPPPIVNSRSSAQRLRSIVEAAVRRAEELKNPYLGKALQEVYNRSLHDRTMAELLDAVLAQKPTDKQTADFQAMVKQTRKEIKDADKGVLRQSSKTPGSNSKSSLKSPTKSDGGSAAQRGVNTEELSDAPGNQNNSPQSSKQRAKRMDTNHTPSKPERPTKRMKRTYSNASSTSSLSSITSDHFQRSPRRPYSGDISANNGPTPLPPPEYRHLGLGHGPKLHSFPLSRSKSSNKPPATSAAPTAEVPADELVAKRRQLQKNFEYTVSDSAVRDPPTVKPPPQRRKSHQTGSPLPLRTQQTRLRNGVTRHDLVDDHDLPSSGSSYHGELLAPPSADGHMVTRGATPNQLGRPPKHVKKGARIKMSPQKAKPTIAGQPRPGGDGDGDGLSDNASELDNDDICSACGGEGEVLCCDGCTRSFHYICLDPPKHGAPQGEWLCRHCIATRLKPQGFGLENNIDGVTDGLLEPIFKKLHGKNPHCFSLPKSVREAFEGVRTAASGEYEDVAPLKSKTRANPDMQLELAKAKEIMKDSVALCFACGGSNTGGREMIPCSFCTLHWHLDCLNPPLATSPFRENPNKPYAKDHAKLTWQCPNHADSEMQTLNEPAVTRRGTIRSAGGKVRKIRRPRHATIKDVGLRRGYVNNGIIEILNDPSDEENDFDTETGVVPRLPEKGIKLDFIDRVKSSALGTSQSVAERDVKKLRIAAATQAHKRQAAKAEMEALRRHSFAEQQVALALSQLQTPSSPVSVGISSVDTLIGTLISEAPQDVAGLFERAEVVTDTQAEFLRLAVARMQEILAKKQQ